MGPPLSPERTRMLLALRINILAKGYSGISLETLKQYMAAFNGNYSMRVVVYVDHTALRQQRYPRPTLGAICKMCGSDVAL